MRLRSRYVMGGCKALHRCGIAANPPIAPERHPRAVTAKPTANGNCVRVRFSIGTLKDASMVAYFSESNRSRLRNVFMGSDPGNSAVRQVSGKHVPTVKRSEAGIRAVQGPNARSVKSPRYP